MELHAAAPQLQPFRTSSGSCWSTRLLRGHPFTDHAPPLPAPAATCAASNAHARRLCACQKQALVPREFAGVATGQAQHLGQQHQAAPLARATQYTAVPYGSIVDAGRPHLPILHACEADFPPLSFQSRARHGGADRYNATAQSFDATAADVALLDPRGAAGRPDPHAAAAAQQECYHAAVSAMRASYDAGAGAFAGDANFSSNAAVSRHLLDSFDFAAPQVAPEATQPVNAGSNTGPLRFWAQRDDDAPGPDDAWRVVELHYVPEDLLDASGGLNVGWFDEQCACMADAPLADRNMQCKCACLAAPLAANSAGFGGAVEPAMRVNGSAEPAWTGDGSNPFFGVDPATGRQRDNWCLKRAQMHPDVARFNTHQCNCESFYAPPGCSILSKTVAGSIVLVSLLQFLALEASSVWVFSSKTSKCSYVLRPCEFCWLMSVGWSLDSRLAVAACSR